MTAHFAHMMGGAQGQKTDGAAIVFWSSSEIQSFISALSGYIEPAEAARLVGKKHLMPAAQTSCAIPKEAIAASQGSMISLVAHGPEANFIYPPRPADPRTPWVQDWTVKARFVARTGGIAGMETSSAADGGTRRTGRSGKPKCPATVDAASMVGGMIGNAISLFGKNKSRWIASRNRSKPSSWPRPWTRLLRTTRKKIGSRVDPGVKAK